MQLDNGFSQILSKSIVNSIYFRLFCEANFNSFTNQEDFSSINEFVSNEISDFSNYKHRAKDINIPFLL